MRHFATSTGLLIASVTHLSHAYFACTMSQAVPVSDLLAPVTGGGGGSGGSLTPSTITVPSSGGCNSFWIAAGGDCTTSKAKSKRATYDMLPCLDTMACATSGGSLGCFDVNTFDYIADDGTCGNLNTGEVKQGCVEALLQDAGMAASTGSSGSATGILSTTGTSTGTKATGTAGTAASQSSSAVVESQNSGTSIAVRSFAGLVGVVIAAIA